MDAAFDRLRRYARSHNLRLSEVARQVVERDLDTADVLAAGPGRARPPGRPRRMSRVSASRTPCRTTPTEYCS